MPVISPPRLATATTLKSASGFHNPIQRLTVASSVRTPRLNTIDIPTPDQRATRGQLLTIARPGTKNVNSNASSSRSVAEMSTATRRPSTTAIAQAATSRRMARRAAGEYRSRLQMDTPEYYGTAHRPPVPIAGSGDLNYHLRFFDYSA